MKLTKSDMQQVESVKDSIRTRVNEDAQYPMQPMIFDKHGVIRFEANPIVDHFMTEVCSLNDIFLWCHDNDIDEKYQEQLAQLIGYSHDGYGTLSYVSDESYYRGAAKREELLEKVNSQK